MRHTTDIDRLHRACDKSATSREPVQVELGLELFEYRQGELMNYEHKEHYRRDWESDGGPRTFRREGEAA